MKTREFVDSNTRNRILEAAGGLFAECGFRDATVRMICERARVNLSAIKYHFGGKDKLYCEVLNYWHEFAIKKYPLLLLLDVLLETFDTACQAKYWSGQSKPNDLIVSNVPVFSWPLLRTHKAHNLA